MPDLEVAHLSKRYADNLVLDDVGFHVIDGEFFTLLGPSGCGKSTTLNSIAGLDVPDEGRITVGDSVFLDRAARVFLEPEQRGLGMVFQSYALWPHMTVADNVGFPLRLRRTPTPQIAARVEEILERVGLHGVGARYPHELSGGQQQRVALARALAHPPRLLLLDEPLSNLDAKLREQARHWLKSLQADTGLTTIYVTHDQSEALSMSDRIAVLDGGRLSQVGTPVEIYETPASLAVGRFVGSCSLLTGRADEVLADGRTRVVLDHDAGEVVAAHSHVSPGQRCVVFVRPEHAEIVAESDRSTALVAGRVTGSAYVGTGRDLTVETSAGTVLVSATEDHQGPCHLRLRGDRCIAFPEAALGDHLDHVR